jgi:hypothetical protein
MTIKDLGIQLGIPLTITVAKFDYAKLDGLPAGNQQYIKKTEMLKPIGYYELFQCWKKQDMYDAACAWMKQFKDFEVHWDFETGCTYLNHVQYPARVYIRDEADYLVFKLKFPTLLKF